jgi:microcystin-dependent protein
MPSSGYAVWSVVVGEQPTTTKWNVLGTNDASFNAGTGLNDTTIQYRHLQSDMIPTGVIHLWSVVTAPSSNWLICDGTAYSRTTYAALYSVIGVTYGSGDGSTTFNVPNFAARVPAGVSSGDSHFSYLGAYGGEETHQLSQGELPYYQLGVSDPGHAHGTAGNYFQDAGGAGNLNVSGGGDGYARSSNVGVYGAGTNISVYSNGSNQSHNNLQPYLTIQYIIKT